MVTESRLTTPDFSSSHQGWKKHSLPISLDEIYTTDGTLTLNTIEHVSSAIFTDHQGNQIQLPIQQTPHTMTEEVAAFAHMIQQPDLNLYQTWLEDASSVHELLYTMRQTAGIRFEAEK